MRFRTELNLQPSSVKICHKDSIILMGSCFSTSIGEKLKQYKYQALVNPYGILYHPLPILNNLKVLSKSEELQIDKIIELDGAFVHYDFHSQVKGRSREKLNSIIRARHLQLRNELAKASFLFLTLGTAYHFYHLPGQFVVGNCHKQTKTLFERRLSPVSEVVDHLNEMVTLIQSHNEHVHIIFTVSPVRHIRDGIINSNRSKAHLISAIHEVIDGTPKVHYFPAYELLLDDLRDYRYFEKDLIHPNSQAIEYIWDKLEVSYMSTSTIAINNKVKKLVNSLNHRPFNPQSIAHKDFLRKLIVDIENLSALHNLNFDTELNTLKASMINN